MIWVLIGVVGIFGGVISGLVGTGSSLLLLPILVYAFGAKSAVPIMAIAAVLANAGRVFVWWNDINWRAVLFYAVPSVPAAALGARTLITLPDEIGNIVLGGMFFGLIFARRWLHARGFGRVPWQLSIAGAVIGFITGIVASSGPLSLAVFAAFGLGRQVLIATEAAASFFVFGAKVAAFDMLGAVTMDTVIYGMIVGAAVIVGTFGAKALLGRVTVRQHEIVIDTVLVIAGIAIIFS